MQQTKKGSAIEALLNTASGYIVACLIYWLIIPHVLGIPYVFKQNIIVTSIFTVVSIVRSYVWRRVFNSQHREAVPKRAPMFTGRRQISLDTFNKHRHGGV